MNRVTLTGCLTADPDVRELAEGRRIASLSIATSEKWIDKESGELRELVERSQVSISSESHIAFAEKYLRKGSSVHVEGSLQTRRWADKQNIERYSTEVVLLPLSGKLKLNTLELSVRTPTATTAATQNHKRKPDGPKNG
jgi:single-strand DNA-binding protein